MKYVEIVPGITVDIENIKSVEMIPEETKGTGFARPARLEVTMYKGRGYVMYPTPGRYGFELSGLETTFVRMGSTQKIYDHILSAMDKETVKV